LEGWRGIRRWEKPVPRRGRGECLFDIGVKSHEREGNAHFEIPSDILTGVRKTASNAKAGPGFAL